MVGNTMTGIQALPMTVIATTILAVVMLATAAFAAEPAKPADDILRLCWAKDILTITADRLPGGEVKVWYIEAFCRRGSTHRDWRETTIPFKTKLLSADADGRSLKLKTVVDGKVEVRHTLRSGRDEVTFDVVLTNTTNQPVDIEWFQPCIRVGTFTGREQDDYFEKCFLFTKRGLTRMHKTHRATRARYTPGQVYVPKGIDLNDVNPRPISKTRPVNGLVGCFSADGRMLLATAWSRTQELFQGVIVCIHSDPHIGGLGPGQKKHLRGKIYLIPNDVEALLRRYRRDFPAGPSHAPHDGPAGAMRPNTAEDAPTPVQASSLSHALSPGCPRRSLRFLPAGFPTALHVLRRVRCRLVALRNLDARARANLE